MSEVLIVGGGLAGASAAILLARAGLAVGVLEREKEPRDKMCGEFLSIEAQRHLQMLGLDGTALGGVPIDRVRLIAGAKAVEARLPFVALGLSRKRLDEALLEQSIRAGAQVERGVKVSEIVGHNVMTSAGTRTADHVLLATGKHDVRGATRPDAVRSDYVAFKMHWKLTLVQQEALRGVIELIVFDGGYAGLQLVDGGHANLCLIIRRRRLAALGKHWTDVLAHLMKVPHMAHRLGDSEPLFQSPITVANLPYGYVCGGASDQTERVFRLGDQGAMTPSLTGDGMAIALRSASLAAASVIAGQSANIYHARLRRNVAVQVRRAMLLQRMTQSGVLMTLGVGVLRVRPRLLGTLAGLTRIPDDQEHQIC